MESLEPADENPFVILGAKPGRLTLHADRGPSMISAPAAALLIEQGVDRRPYTSSDNPFSEAQFKTLKYHCSYPDRFGSLEHARVERCMPPPSQPGPWVGAMMRHLFATRLMAPAIAPGGGHAGGALEMCAGSAGRLANGSHGARRPDSSPSSNQDLDPITRRKNEPKHGFALES